MTRPLTHDVFLERARAIHGEKYDYSDSQYSNGRTKIKVKCVLHGTFLVTPENHIHNHSGCPQCHLKRATVGQISGTYWKRLLGGAKRRAIPVLLTQKEAWSLFVKQEGKCVYTGWDLSFTTNGVGQTASLDRKDPYGPYSIENCHWVHRHVNFAKHTLRESAFFDLCRQVRRHIGL